MTLNTADNINYVDLLGASDIDEGLDAFARKFFHAIGVVKFEERESSHYPDERYFCGDHASLSFAVSYSDETGHDDLPYWVSIESRTANAESILGTVDQLVRTRLHPIGLRFALMLDFGTLDQRRVDY